MTQQAQQIQGTQNIQEVLENKHENRMALPVMNYSSFATSCKECVFAEKWGNHQTGCEFARLERFKMHGGLVQVTERWEKISDLVEKGQIKENVELDPDKWVLVQYKDKKYHGFSPPFEDAPLFEEESIYYEMPRYCDKCRNEEWADNHKGKNIKEQAQEETKLKVSCVIVMNENTTFEELQKSVTSIEAQSFKANEIILLNLNSPIQKDAIATLLKNTDIAHYRYIKPLIKSDEFGLLECYRQARGKWIIQLCGGESLSTNQIDDINNMLNERLERCILWEISPTVLAFQKRTLVEYSLEGIKQKAKDENSEFLIKKGY